jgi:hypothetical protein
MTTPGGPRVPPCWVTVPSDPPVIQRLMLQWKREAEQMAGPGPGRDPYEQPEDLR